MSGTCTPTLAPDYRCANASAAEWHLQMGCHADGSLDYVPVRLFGFCGLQCRGSEPFMPFLTPSHYFPSLSLTLPSPLLVLLTFLTSLTSLSFSLIPFLVSLYLLCPSLPSPYLSFPSLTCPYLPLPLLPSPHLQLSSLTSPLHPLTFQCLPFTSSYLPLPPSSFLNFPSLPLPPLTSLAFPYIPLPSIISPFPFFTSLYIALPSQYPLTFPYFP